jgi:hypothetical protein
MTTPKTSRRRLYTDTIHMRRTGERYMSRWLAYLTPARDWSLRLHKFWRGDDLRAPHDHPFDFWTFPLTSYVEDVYSRGLWPGWIIKRRTVKAFRWHYRPASFKHIVIGRADGKTIPFFTICVARERERRWGFWTTPTTFVPWREYK